MARPRKDGPPDEPVEVVKLPNTEAEIVASRLRDAGIDATVFASGSSADLVEIQFSHGSRVMVRRDALDAAEAVLAEWADTGVTDSELAAQADAAVETDSGDGAVI